MGGGAREKQPRFEPAPSLTIKIINTKWCWTQYQLPLQLKPQLKESHWQVSAVKEKVFEEKEKGELP